MKAAEGELVAENQRLREALEQKTKVAAKALAAQQRRVLEMEQYAAELGAANERVSQVNEKLKTALRVLEDRDRRLSEDLAQAQRFQRRILPGAPISEVVSFAVAYHPAEVVGGDFYDITPIGDGDRAWRVFIADLIGHGIQAALRTMILKSEYDRVKAADTPREVLTLLNRQIVAVYPGLELHCSAACFDVHVDAGAGRVRYATAAHPPLLHVCDGVPRQIYLPGPFLGVAHAAEFPEVTVRAAAGDRLFAYTDGLVEEWGAEDELGQRKVELALAGGGLLCDVVSRVVADLVDHVTAGELHDDVTLVGLEVTN